MRTSNLYCFKAIQYSNKFIFSNYKLYVCHYINHKYILFTCSEYIMYLSVLSTHKTKIWPCSVTLRTIKRYNYLKNRVLFKTFYGTKCFIILNLNYDSIFIRWIVWCSERRNKMSIRYLFLTKRRFCSMHLLKVTNRDNHIAPYTYMIQVNQQYVPLYGNVLRGKLEE